MKILPSVTSSELPGSKITADPKFDVLRKALADLQPGVWLPVECADEKELGSIRSITAHFLRGFYSTRKYGLRLFITKLPGWTLRDGNS